MLKDSANLLLTNASKVEDFPKRSGHVVLSTCDKDAPSNDSFLGFALHELVLVHELEDMLSGIGDIRSHIDSLAKRNNLLVCLHQTLLSLVCVGVVLGTGQSLVSLGFGKGDSRGQMLTLDEFILRSTDTAWIITSLVIIGKRTPFRPSIDDASANDDTAALADHVSAGKLLDQVRGVFFAVGAAKHIVQVFLEPGSICSASSIGICARQRRRKHFGLVGLRLIDVGDLVKDFSCSLRFLSSAPQLLPLLLYCDSYGGVCFERGSSNPELIVEDLDKER